MTSASAAALLVTIMDILAVGALGLTGDVHWGVSVAAGCALLLSWPVKARIPNSVLVGALIVVILSPAALMFRLHWHPVVAVAHAVPMAHAILWFAPRNAIYRGWRIGIGFMELVLASGLTVDFYLPLSIIIFIILASVAISCDFMERQLALRSPVDQGRPLPAGYIRRSIGLALLIFLSAAIIFPLLPRPKSASNVMAQAAGYSERVDLAQWSRLTNTSGGAVAMRAYPPAGKDLSTEALMGLIRSRTLEVFDGSSWYPAARSRRRTSQFISNLENSREIVRIEIVREPIGSDYLPVPYGNAVVTFEDNDGTQRRANQTHSGDWVEPGSADRRVRYLVTFIPNDLRYLRERGTYDVPNDSHLKVPDNLRTERMLKLAKSIFGNTKGVREKINDLSRFYRREGFGVTSETTTAVDEGIEQQVRKLGLEPIERFLFLSKEGHCEWFASSAAILLRLAGVPTRLVAGFRITTVQNSGTQTIRTGDGHAWLEAYAGTAGWIPVDPTPRMTTLSSIFDVFRNLSDMLSARWYRYVVSYESDGRGAAIDLSSWARRKNKAMSGDSQSSGPTNWQDLARGSAAPIMISLVTVILVLIVIYGLRKSRSMIYWGSAQLRLERKKQDRWLRKNGWHRVESSGQLIRAAESRYGPECAKKLESWDQLYSRLRFGVPIEPASLRSNLVQLSEIRRDLWNIQRGSTRSSGQRSARN